MTAFLKIVNYDKIKFTFLFLDIVKNQPFDLRYQCTPNDIIRVSVKRGVGVGVGVGVGAGAGVSLFFTYFLCHFSFF